ncbi:MAG: hypothetical protein ACLR1T_17585 [Evtepia gabavorous]
MVISQFYGAKEEEKVGQAVQTSLLLVLLLCGYSRRWGLPWSPACSGSWPRRRMCFPRRPGTSGSTSPGCRG